MLVSRLPPKTEPAPDVIACLSAIATEGEGGRIWAVTYIKHLTRPSAERAVAVLSWQKQMDAVGVAGQVRLHFSDEE